ncbi:MAG: Arylsulfatase [Firmicutes bacterium ADurb.Bin193]|nr:MAG: Arylsulfatase [Firmicutes bacterium ADurb.Bin193]
MKKRNILLITSDQQRWDTVGYMNDKIKTPNLDKLLKKGIAFERAYTCNPVCTPTRVSILTGHYPSKHGCYTIGTGLEDDYPTTIPKILGENGYFTSLIGKAHFKPCLTEGGFESLPSILDRDFYRNWSGPYFGFEYCQLVIGHSCEILASGMHYGLWLEEQGLDVSKYFGNNKYTDFGTWDLPQEYSNSKWTADLTIKAVEMAQEKDKPFFIWSSFEDPHNPCFVPEPWASMYNKEDMPVYGLREGELEGKPPFYSTIVEKKPDTGYACDDLDFGEKDWHCISPLPFMDDEKKRDIMTKYYGMVSQMDHHIGRIVDYLEEKGLMEDTIIVFTTDHGDYMGNHGLWWKGLPAYEDVQKIPFLVVHPDCKTPNQRSTALQSIVDLGATFLSFAGVKPPVGLQGVNQENAWIDAKNSQRDWAMVEFRPSQSSFMQKTFITERYKLVVYHNREYGELYDLHDDPDQLRNLWDNPQYADVKFLLFRRFISAEMEKDGELCERTSPA